jgi:DNA (cytosine-5)-methyltransferase 1
MKAISLFSGAGGFDIGIIKAGFEVIWANDNNKDACNTYSNNIGKHIICDNFESHLNDLIEFQNKTDLVFGGPPCQGFSVAGKMNPDDPRSQQIWNFARAIEIIKPKAFIMENVKALGSLNKWSSTRSNLLKYFKEIGYSTNFIVLNATEFNVPQARERVFFIGFKTKSFFIPDLEKMVEPYKVISQTVRESLRVLDKAGSGNNINLCNAKITLTTKPVLRKSPYAGMLFNGAGRPIRINGYSATLPASMGGNKTPIIDEDELYKNKPSWVEKYHSEVVNAQITPEYKIAPRQLRRLTVDECAVLQTFPLNFKFVGSQSSIYKQIGNAVPVNLGFSIAKMIYDYLMDNQKKISIPKSNYQMEIV